jgi:tRNA(Arg) A34 adenosine deaminase TadA
MANNVEFMRRAIALARHAVESKSGGSFDCVIVKDGAVFAEGFIQINTVPDAHDSFSGFQKA